jgi:hypothetical protein
MASRENERRRESENLKDAIDRSVWKTVSGTDRDDAVQPIVLWGACLVRIQVSTTIFPPALSSSIVRWASTISSS